VEKGWIRARFGRFANPSTRAKAGRLIHRTCLLYTALQCTWGKRPLCTRTCPRASAHPCGCWDRAFTSLAHPLSTRRARYPRKGCGYARIRGWGRNSGCSVHRAVGCTWLHSRGKHRRQMWLNEAKGFTRRARAPRHIAAPRWRPAAPGSAPAARRLGVGLPVVMNVHFRSGHYGQRPKRAIGFLHLNYGNYPYPRRNTCRSANGHISKRERQPPLPSFPEMLLPFVLPV
jgi:hypothetical protein